MSNIGLLFLGEGSAGASHAAIRDTGGSVRDRSVCSVSVPPASAGEEAGGLGLGSVSERFDIAGNLGRLRARRGVG